MRRNLPTLRTFAILAMALPACHPAPMTADEAEAALDEAQMSHQVEALTAGTQELTTTFTVGQAADATAEEIVGFVTSHLPCAEVVRDGAKLTVTYGKLPGACTWRGHTYTGTHVVTVTRNEADQVVVQHEWQGVKNEKLMVAGTATVTWDFQAKTRHVVHQVNWTRLADGRQGVGTGDRVQTPLAGGLAEGFEVSGTRHWEGRRGAWDLAIDGVEVRWADPIPQAGTYTLDTPFGITATLTFERVDDATIQATITDGSRTLVYRVDAAGVATRM